MYEQKHIDLIGAW